MPAPPYVFGHLDARQAQRGELRPQIERKRLRLVPLHDVRPDLGLGELADGAAQELLLARRAEVHPVKNIRIEARGRVAAW